MMMMMNLVLLLRMGVNEYHTLPTLSHLKSGWEPKKCAPTDDENPGAHRVLPSPHVPRTPPPAPLAAAEEPSGAPAPSGPEPRHRPPGAPVHPPGMAGWPRPQELVSGGSGGSPDPEPRPPCPGGGLDTTRIFGENIKYRKLSLKELDLFCVVAI